MIKFYGVRFAKYLVWMKGVRHDRIDREIINAISYYIEQLLYRNADLIIELDRWNIKVLKY